MRFLMMHFAGRYDPILTLLATGLLFFSGSCATTGTVLSTSGLQDIDAEVETGSFALILHSSQGQRYMDTVAILDIEGDAYEIEPAAAPYNFTVVEGLTGQQALQTARRFIDFYAGHNTTGQQAITSPAGDVIGYELRPLYHPFVYGVSDVMDITYDHQPQGRVIVSVELLFHVEQQLRGGINSSITN